MNDFCALNNSPYEEEEEEEEEEFEHLHILYYL